MGDGEIRIELPEEQGTVISEARQPDPCVLVIFGATGDLSRRKLFPSLYHMAVDKTLPENFAIIGLGTREKSEDAFRESLRRTTENFSQEKSLDNRVWDQFVSGVYYVRGRVNEPATFTALCERLAEVDRQHGTQGNYLFFFATPPNTFELILQRLRDAGLLYPADSAEQAPWSRVLIEKPFGHDLDSARELNRLAAESAKENQIYRIDHYLGKETVQNIIVFRFGNSIFEPIWNRKYIDHVQITAAEDIGIEERGRFYDEIGVVRDVVQNHLMQVLALCAMEPPVSFRAEEIRNEKTQVFRSLRPMITELDVRENVVLGQYEGYQEERNVAPGSRTPTYAAMKVMIDNWRWQGVPFYLRAGKRLRKRLTEVSIFFQEVPLCLFGGEKSCQMLDANVLTLRIQPDEGITLRFVCKVPGDELSVNSVLMDFSYARTFRKDTIHDAYLRLFLDAMRGDQTLFARADGVELEWSFVMPIISAWESSDEKPCLYKAGSDGPTEANDLVVKSGHSWRALQ